ncbi:MAG: transposase [Lachnospiraceae bacterium]|nr:transposase [Lachnospiraceae bacterium]
MDNLTTEAMEFIISRLIERGIDAAKEAREKPNDQFCQGRSLAYYEMLDILRSEIIIHDADLKSFGLNFDIEGVML